MQFTVILEHRVNLVLYFILKRISLTFTVDKTLREAVIPEFDGDSFLEFPTLEGVGKTFALEVWFLPSVPDGVLLYNGQKGEGGDFIALTLKNGHVTFSFNLGSGVANLV